jgi:hypothetical protein
LDFKDYYCGGILSDQKEGIAPPAILCILMMESLYIEVFKNKSKSATERVADFIS